MRPHDNKSRKLKGMTLIEVIVGMTIIVLVTIIAYMGVSTAAGFVQEGTELRNDDGYAVAAMEQIKDAPTSTATVKAVGYDVKVVTWATDDSANKETDAAGNVVTAVVEKGTKTANVGVAEVITGKIDYKMYLPVIPSEETH